MSDNLEGFTQEELDDLFGRGNGDPDAHGYPGEENSND
jgi:hypothetical protein